MILGEYLYVYVTSNAIALILKNIFLDTIMKMFLKDEVT